MLIRGPNNEWNNSVSTRYLQLARMNNQILLLVIDLHVLVTPAKGIQLLLSLHGPSPAKAWAVLLSPDRTRMDDSMELFVDRFHLNELLTNWPSNKVHMA